MMRALALLITLSVPASAQTGPTPEEVAAAHAACMAEVQQECLFTLAIAAGLQEDREDAMHRSLNWIAGAQAKAGGIAGAKRTLALTEPGEDALLALGRWDEAYAVAERQFPMIIVEHGSAEGSFKTNMVRHMLAVNEADLAFATALSIPDGWGERDDALTLIFDYHLEDQDFLAASGAYALMQDRASPNRNRAFPALVEAFAAAGKKAGATALLDNADDPEAQAQARLRLAAALFSAGSVADAKVQLDLVFASATGADRRGPPQWGLSVLVDAADLALSIGEIAVARQHAEAAFAIIDQDRENVGSWFVDTPGNPINLIRAATLLELAGSPDKAKVMFDYAALPPPTSEHPQQRMMRQIASFISQTRLQKRADAETTLQGLMEMETGPDGSVMRDNLRDAALTLVSLGFLQEAQSVADQIDQLRYGGGWSHDIYMALLAKDPSLAPNLLAGIRSAFIQVEVSVIWAQSLFASGDAARAQGVLQSLVSDHAARMDEEYSVPEYRTQALSRIAKAQASLGFTDDAAATRTMGLSFASASKRPHQRISALLSLAESFP